jgi:hypothetical protein
MEIGPVTGIRNVPVIKAPPADMGLSAVFDIENFARIGDETYTPSDGKSAGGREDEFDDPLVEEDVQEPSAKFLDDAPRRQVSFFA